MTAVPQTPNQEPPTGRFLRSRGLLIPKDPILNVGRVRQAIRQDTYERKECDAVERIVDANDTVLELGGGIGYMSTLVAVRKSVRKVVTYEANPSLIPYIRSVHAANNANNAELRHAVLAAEDGPPIPFYERKNFLASSMDKATGRHNIVATHQIKRHVLKPVLEALKPTVLICDIEGAEAHLLPAGDWSGLRAAIIELHPQWIGADGVRAVFDCMHKAGLTYFPKASEAKVVTFRKDW